MRIIIETIENKDQRYNTIGDWQFIGDELIIKVSKLGDERYEFLVGLHELIEAYLCKAYGISSEEVDEFDMAHEDDKDPGGIPTAPYYRQHLLATVLEHIIADELEVDWDMYDSKIEQVSATYGTQIIETQRVNSLYSTKIQQMGEEIATLRNEVALLKSAKQLGDTIESRLHGEINVLKTKLEKVSKDTEIVNWLADPNGASCDDFEDLMTHAWNDIEFRNYAHKRIAELSAKKVKK